MMTLLGCAVLAVTGLAAPGCGTGPAGQGSQLAPCPDRPNCVSSQSRDKAHAMAPLTYTGNRDKAMARLLALVSALPRTRVVTAAPDYLHVEFRSKWLRFVDDVEFRLPFEEPGIIQFRSASRLGYSDMGVNRKRMERIRKLFESKTS